MFIPKLAIILATYQNDTRLMKCIESILDVWQSDWQLIIIDRNEMETYTTEKEFFYRLAASPHHSEEDRHIVVLSVPESISEFEYLTLGIASAKRQGILYYLNTTDNILFTDSMAKITDLFNLFKKYDIIGLDDGTLKIEEDPDYELLKEEADFINPQFCQVSSELRVWNYYLVTDLFLLTSKAWEDQYADHKRGFTDYCKGKKYDSSI